MVPAHAGMFIAMWSPRRSLGMATTCVVPYTRYTRATDSRSPVRPAHDLRTTKWTVPYISLPRGADFVDPGNRAASRMARECMQERFMFVITLKWRDPWWSNPGWWNLIISLSIAFLF